MQHFTTNDGISIAYLDAGSRAAPPIILVIFSSTVPSPSRYPASVSRLLIIVDLLRPAPWLHRLIRRLSPTPPIPPSPPHHRPRPPRAWRLSQTRDWPSRRPPCYGSSQPNHPPRPPPRRDHRHRHQSGLRHPLVLR